VTATVCNCMFWPRARHLKFPFPWDQGTLPTTSEPDTCTCQMSSKSVRWQTGRPRYEKISSVAVGEIACTSVIPPGNGQDAAVKLNSTLCLCRPWMDRQLLNSRFNSL